MRRNSPQAGSATSKVTRLLIKNGLLLILISQAGCHSWRDQWLAFPHKHKGQHTSYQKALVWARSLPTIYWNESQCGSLFSESSSREPDNPAEPLPVSALETRKCSSAVCLTTLTGCIQSASNQRRAQGAGIPQLDQNKWLFAAKLTIFPLLPL